LRSSVRFFRNAWWSSFLEQKETKETKNLSGLSVFVGGTRTSHDFAPHHFAKTLGRIMVGKMMRLRCGDSFVFVAISCWFLPECVVELFLEQQAAKETKNLR